MAIYYARKNGNVNATDIWATTPSGAAGDFFSSFTNQDILMLNNFNVTFNVNTTVAEIRADNAYGATSESTGRAFILDNTTITANIFGSSSIGNQLPFSYDGSQSATIIGNIYAVNRAGSIVLRTSGNGTMNIVGAIYGGSANSDIGASCINSSKLNIIGNIYGGSNNSAFGVLISSSSDISIIGNVYGGSGAGTAGVVLGTSVTITIVGNVYGGSVSTISGAFFPLGVANNSAGNIIIIGTSIGGIAMAGSAIVSGAVGSLSVIRAKGNGFGNGSVGLGSVVGVAGNATGLTKVYEIEYGDLGQSPTSGPVFIEPDTTNVAVFYAGSGVPKKTLVSGDSVLNVFPSGSDVRYGISYNAGNNVGSMKVPGAASVASGVPVDNTIGTAVLTVDDISKVWDVPVSGISVSGSIGERLKNCSTVASMGQQLAAALSNLN